ncbi:MAG TPA: alpha/beta fold hydrolase [Phycisphaerales bacterium]|nr:alpha/beta fold hydrolase [Phycisphaerales bacterium]HMP37723.1 alpha/beta fold hydrolase [Phycisphaerales bacterium]
MHGRTVSKEIDPGRYLRWLRAGIVTCAVDLPGHGERFEESLQRQESTLEVVERMVEEIDGVVAALEEIAPIDPARIAIGGMSAGGMAAIVRLCREHRFACASVEATTGSWRWQSHRPMWDAERATRLNPIEHLGGWRDIPFQALHALHDEWVAAEGQREFLDALRRRAGGPDGASRIEFVLFEERTGAPFEHAGFGRLSAVAKDAQLRWFRRWLLE